MDEHQSLSHTVWDCKYHVVFIPKCRRRTLYLELRKHLGEVFRKLAVQKEAKIEEGHLMPDHVHMMISIPPKYSVSQVVGFIKGKSAIHLARVYGEEAQLRGPTLLGARLLRQHCGTGRGGNPRLHPQPGEGGSEIGATQSLALTKPPSGGSTFRGRVSDPSCRPGRLQS
jgi:REP element-mobilizing transposase RayT